MRDPFSIVVNISGEADIATASALHSAVRTALKDVDGPACVGLDRHDVESIDGAGLGNVLSARRWARDRDVALYLVRPSRSCARLLDVLRRQHLVAA